jgi:hypothetical protein
MSGRFIVNGVPDGGIIVGDIKDEVPESLICLYFGPKSSKSGWKYQCKTTPEEQDAMLSLYRRVYESQDIPNKEITVQFARGLILMSSGTKVNWEEFRVDRRKYHECLRKRKELIRKEKSEREGKGERGIAPSTIGKRRCTMPMGLIGDDFLASLKLTVKTEVGDDGSVMPMGKRSGGKDRVDNVSPSWSKAEIDEMVGVISDRSTLLKKCRVSLGDITGIRDNKEDALRRAKLMRDDRTLMIGKYKLEIDRIAANELLLRARMEERTSLLASLESADAFESEKETLVAQLLRDESNRESLFVSRVVEERTSRRSQQIVSDCEETITLLEKELEYTRDEYTNLTQKVKALEGQAVSMDKQLRMMREVFGDSLWPRPISSCSESPVHLVHTLNPCPVCWLWYSCWDYVTLGCGHSYHPWYLAKYAKVSSKCLLVSYEQPFFPENQVVLGLRIAMNCAITSTTKEASLSMDISPDTKVKLEGTLN